MSNLPIAQSAQFLTQRCLRLILMPTEQCNFRCVYCYEDFALGKMSPKVVASVKKLIERRLPKLDLLSISWFGGEPLLAWDVVEDIQSFACGLRDEQPDLVIDGAITSNGSRLTLERFRRLLALRVRRFQISLDGPAEVHDRTRVRVGGRGSFAAIWKNLLAMRGVADDFRVLIRLHFTRENLSPLASLIDQLAAAFGGDERFLVSPRPIRREGGPNDDKLPVLEAGEYRPHLEALRARAAAAGLGVHGGPFASPNALPGCYAAAANSYVVRSNGELAKCTVAFGDPRNRVGVLKPDGEVELDSDKMLWWMRGVFGGGKEALQCPLRGGSVDLFEAS